MAYYSLKDLGQEKIHITKGNSKIGKNIYSFSTLPGYEYIRIKEKGILLDIHGTCKGVCKECENGGCYAIRDAKRFHNTAFKAWAMNTMLLRMHRDETFQKISEYLQKNKVKILRWNVAGEIENYGQLCALVKLAESNPDTIIYFYTKRFFEIREYINTFKKFPDNLICNISKWKDNLKGYEKDFKNLNVFAYDDGTDEELKNWVHCPAVNKDGNKTGVTCEKCKRCFRKDSVNKTAVYAH